MFKRIAKFFHTASVIRNTGSSTITHNTALALETETHSVTTATVSGQGTETQLRDSTGGYLWRLRTNGAAKASINFNGLAAFGDGSDPIPIFGSAWAGAVFGSQGEVAAVAHTGGAERAVAFNAANPTVGGWRNRVAGSSALIQQISSGALNFYFGQNGLAGTVNYSAKLPWLSAAADGNDATKTVVTVNQAGARTHIFPPLAFPTAPSSTIPQCFISDIGSISDFAGNFDLLRNSYRDTANSTISMKVGTGVISRLSFFGWQLFTAPTVSPGVVQIYTQREGMPIAGKQWADMLASRSLNTIFQNTTGYEIEVSVMLSLASASTVSGVTGTTTPPTIVASQVAVTSSGTTVVQTINMRVANLAFYRALVVTGSPTLVAWSEMR